MAIYQIQLINPNLGLNRTIQCSACIAKLISGEIDQSEQKFLRPQEIQAGYVVTCVSYPLSDCVLETHQEQVLYKSGLYYSNPL
jgi:ferredoxin